MGARGGNPKVVGGLRWPGVSGWLPGPVSGASVRYMLTNLE